MKRRVLIIVTGDPCRSGRTAEATRIAAGLSTHEGLAVTLCFRGPAARALGEDTESLIDGDYFPQYLPVLTRSGSVVVAGDASAPEADAPNLPQFERLSEKDLQALIANSDRIVRF